MDKDMLHADARRCGCGGCTPVSSGTLSPLRFADFLFIFRFYCPHFFLFLGRHHRAPWRERPPCPMGCMAWSMERPETFFDKLNDALELTEALHRSSLVDNAIGSAVTPPVEEGGIQLGLGAVPCEESE
jgi:hypothetical protein